MPCEYNQEIPFDATPSNENITTNVNNATNLLNKPNSISFKNLFLKTIKQSPKIKSISVITLLHLYLKKIIKFCIKEKKKIFFTSTFFLSRSFFSPFFFYIIQSLFKQATSIPSLLNSENISPLRSGSEKQDTLQYTTFSPPLISYTQNAL